MPLSSRYWAVVAVLIGAVSLSFEAEASDTIVFRHASVLPMDRDVVLSDRDVVVRGGRIASIGPDAATHIAEGDTVIDARGKYLLPGLVDFHTHPSPSDLISDVFYGVTTIATFNGELLQWREAKLALPPEAPNIVSTTRILDGPIPTWWGNYSLEDPNAVPGVIDRSIGLGASMAKVYSQMTMPIMKAIVEHAHLRGIAVAGHVPEGLPIDYVLGPDGLDLVAHSEELTHYLSATPTDGDIDKVVDHVARHDIAVIPDLVVIQKIPMLAMDGKQVLAEPGARFLAPVDYQEWLPRNNDYAHRANLSKFMAAIERQFALQKRITKKLNDAGVLLVSGTDAPDNCLPGEALHEELKILVGAGLSNYAALRSMTFNPGLFVVSRIRSEVNDRFGVVAPGARADLLLVDGNPLQDLSALDRISGSMVAGHWRTQDEMTAAHERVGAELKVAHARVDDYERLWSAKDIPGLIALFDATPTQSDAPFSDGALSADAMSLESQGRAADAVGLLQHAERLLPESIALRNKLGEIALHAGMKAVAAVAFRETLVLAPDDAVALHGLREIR